MSTKVNRVLVLSVETTGISPKHNSKYAIPLDELTYIPIDAYPFIVQLSFIVYDVAERKIIKLYNRYIQIPDNVYIAEEITVLTGISNAFCRKHGVHITEAIMELYNEYIFCDCVVGHNIDIQREFINIEFVRNHEFLIRKCPSHMSMFNPTFEQINRIRVFCTMIYGRREMWQHDTSVAAATAKNPSLRILYEFLYGTARPCVHSNVFVCLECWLMLTKNPAMLPFEMPPAPAPAPAPARRRDLDVGYRLLFVRWFLSMLYSTMRGIRNTT
jgi:DNA polymerase III epsilon subunit-like protein